MNRDVAADDGSLIYYDGDYPSLDHDDGPNPPENPEILQHLALQQGVAFDVPRYLEMARIAGGPVLEIGAGTGRITLPLARREISVTAIEVAEGMSAQLQRKLQSETAEVNKRIDLVPGDITTLRLPGRSFRLALMPFNVLNLLDRLDHQLAALKTAHTLLAPAGHLVIDVPNPLMLPLGEQRVPSVSEPRQHPVTGSSYHKFSLAGAMDDQQRQRLYGWYDERLPGGLVKRVPYAFSWRLVFRFELEFMLQSCGFAVDAVQGGHNAEPFQSDSPRIVALARKL